jgi:hypothetical protein
MFKRTLSFLLFLLFTLTLATFQNIHANGFGVSGNFSSYHYKLVSGEQVSTPDVYVLFFNNFDIEIEVEMFPSIRSIDNSQVSIDGRVDFIIDERVVKIPANSTLRVPIGITVAEDAPAGEYRLGLAAEVIPDELNGITVTGSAELQTRLTIFGEAGDLEIRTFDLFDVPLSAELKLYRVDEGNLSPVANSNTGIIMDRYIPGNYIVIGYYKGYEIGRESFQILDLETTVINLIAQTVFIEDITVTPQLSVSTGLLVSVRINYVIRNIHTMVEDVRLILDTNFDSVQIEYSEQDSIPFLPESLVEGNFNYIPPEGWMTGLYTFTLEGFRGPYTDETSDFLGESPTRNLNVPEQYVVTPVPDPDPEPDPEPDLDPEHESSNTLLLVLLIVLGGLLTGWIILLFKKPLDAFEYATRVLKKAGFDMGSKHVKTVLKRVEKRMRPGTDFLEEKIGTNAYYKKVDEYLIEIDAFNDEGNQKPRKVLILNQVLVLQRELFKKNKNKVASIFIPSIGEIDRIDEDKNKKIDNDALEINTDQSSKSTPNESTNVGNESTNSSKDETDSKSDKNKEPSSSNHEEVSEEEQYSKEPKKSSNKLD